MSACEHLESPGFLSDASAAQHTTFAWYVSIVQLSRSCSCFDRVPLVMCFISVCQSIGHFKVQFQHRKSVFIPDCCHRCSDAWSTSASSPLFLTLPLRSAATPPLRRVLVIRASQVKSLPFQHRKAHFILDCCHRCSDAWSTSASSPFVRTLPLRSASFDILSVVFAFQHFRQHQLYHLQSASASFRSTVHS